MPNCGGFVSSVDLFGVLNVNELGVVVPVFTAVLFPNRPVGGVALVVVATDPNVSAVGLVNVAVLPNWKALASEEEEKTH